MREKYESLSLTTLKDLAKARGLKGISTLRKPELIERMLQEDVAEVSNKAAEVREITHEETVRQENRARESRPSYESNERKRSRKVYNQTYICNGLLIYSNKFIFKFIILRTFTLCKCFYFKKGLTM